MTTSGSTSGFEDPYSLWDAAYVLGALPAAQRREFETHLLGCPSCRAAVAELSGMPALLGTLELADVRAMQEPPPLPPTVRAQVLDRVRWRRRRSRWVLSAAAAAFAAVVAAAVVLAVRPDLVGRSSSASGDAPPALALAPMTKTPFAATIAMTSFSWGTRIDMQCRYDQSVSAGADLPRMLGIVVIGRDGSATQIATWLALDDADANPSANTAMPMATIAAVRVVTVDSGQVLLERTL